MATSPAGLSQLPPGRTDTVATEIQASTWPYHHCETSNQLDLQGSNSSTCPPRPSKYSGTSVSQTRRHPRPEQGLPQSSMERYAEKQQQGEDRASRLSPEHPAGVAAPFSQHLIPDHPAPTSLNELHPGRHDHPSVPHEHDPAPREHDAAPHDRAPAPHEHAPAPHAHAPVHVRNRRREYLDRNPAYFDSVEHELAGRSLFPLLLAHKWPR